MVLEAEKFVAVMNFSRLEVSASTRTDFPIFPWKLLTSPVGKVTLMR